MTNEDKIRSMPVDDLAEWVLNATENDADFGKQLCDICPYLNICHYGEYGTEDIMPDVDGCHEATLIWLKRECGEREAE